MDHATRLIRLCDCGDTGQFDIARESPVWKQALLIGAVGIVALSSCPAGAQNKDMDTTDTPAAPTLQYDGALAKTLGGNEQDMRSDVLVVLKTGLSKVAA